MVEWLKHVAVIVGIFTADFKIKNYIEVTKAIGQEETKCRNMLIIRKHHNKGAFLNAGETRQKMIMGISVAFTLLATIIFVLTLGQGGKGLLKWGLTILLGGAYSNTYDRIVRKYVVDYVSFNVPVKGIRRVIFNISDFCIMIGALFSVIGFHE